MHMHIQRCTYLYLNAHTYLFTHSIFLQHANLTNAPIFIQTSFMYFKWSSTYTGVKSM